MSAPSFNFGASSNPFGSKPASTSAFGQPATTTTAGSTPSAPTSSIFGQAPANIPSSSSGNLFGSLNATSGAAKPLFGGLAGSTPSSGPATPSLFGSNTGTSSPFGGGAGTTANKPDTTQSNSLFGGGSGASGFSFGQKKDEAGSGTPSMGAPAQNATGNSSQPQAGSLFGGGGSNNKPAGSGLFGNAGSSAPAGSTTPAPAKSFSFTNSTTPAAPPPAAGNLFGSLKPADSSNPPAPQTSGGLFGGNNSNAAGAGNLFSNAKPAAASGASLFGSGGAAATSNASAPAATSTAPASKPTFGFPPKSDAEASQPSTSTATTSSTGATASAAPASGGLFGSKPAATSAPSGAASTTSTGNLFGGGADSLKTTSTSTPAGSGAAAPTTGNLFGNKPAETGTSSATNGAQSTTSGLFAPKPSGADNSASTNTANSGGGNTTSNTSGAAAGPLGASTAGPAPQLSRLKNKTMDEIITRWASDLSKYQKEFQDQAAKVAAWDRLLVDNGDKIQKLYNSTFEAERASAEVERQLTMVEGQQGEISEWLDRYEAEIDKMFSQQVGRAEALQGPDQERERTYKLAERLTERLEEMGKDLANMIQEINSASASLSQTSKPDDPLSQIIRVLNGHLSQLQWIDQNAATLQAKLAAAQKAGQALATNGRSSVENDPADDFYRSFMSRR